MFELAIGIGIYSYLIFALGVLRLINQLTLIPLTFLFLIFLLCILLPKRNNLNQIKRLTGIEKTIFLLILLLALVSLLGAFAPEISFDALWYHLTLPKIYIQDHSIQHIPGGLLYYSDMPKLIDLIFVPALMLGGETLAKITHFIFGILTCVALYKSSRFFLSRTQSLLVVLIFYSNIVIIWLSTVAYIDLGRTFYELMAFWGFVIYLKSKDKKWLIESAVMLGLAISSKILAAGSLLIFIGLIFYFTKNKRLIFQYSAISLSIVLPWLTFAFLNTGNPFYPFFTNIYPLSLDFNIPSIISGVFKSFVINQDPISPIYIIVLPMIALIYKKFSHSERIALLYFLLSFLIWLIAPNSGGGRFLAAYLPVYSILVVLVLHHLDDLVLKKGILVLIFSLAILSFAYRLVAQGKYIPYFTGKETKRVFLIKHLNFKYGDFYDSDDYFKNNLNNNDKVLLYGLHNLYYVNFPFLDSSWVKPGDKFNYILTQNTNLPLRFNNWDMIYQNNLTGVKLYTFNKTLWIY